VAGFTTTVFPMARAGATFQAVMAMGKFHGTMRAQTPSGSRKVTLMPGAATGTLWPPTLVVTPA
jgi:hypothetical protein